MNALSKVSLLFNLLIFAAFSMAPAQENQRPKIGYVLSGGGAKGMAHVGVLKVLEEVGLQPDYITGTSMGSIMGGLYSIGYTADDLSEIIETVDWSTVLTNEVPSTKVTVRRKREYSRHILEVPVYDGKPELPAGLIEGQKLSALFSELTWPQAGVDDFNDFPYPFTCIGADIITGEKVLLNNGDLSSAMRSSMAIPSVFTAVERDGHLLVDGGVVRNFPVQEALDMGADIIIGVYVGFDPEMSPEQLRSLTAVITRASLLAGAQDVDSQMPLVDHLILPDLKGYTPADFTSGVEIMRRGEEAARAQIDQLQALADSINALGPPRRIHQLPEHDSLYISDIEVLHASEKLERFLESKAGIDTGTYIHPDALNEGIDELFGTLFFTKIEYYFERLDTSYQLVLRIKEKAPSTFHVGVHYDNGFGPGLLLNFTHLNAFVEGSRASITADISEAPIFHGYYDFHVGKKRSFIGTAFFRGERGRLPFYEEGLDLGDYKHTVIHTGFGLRQILATNNVLGAEIYFRQSNLSLTSSLKQVLSETEDNPLFLFLDNFIYRGPELAFFYHHNSFDSYRYPMRGTDFSIRYRQAFNTQYITKFDLPDSIEVDNDVSKSRMDPYWRLESTFENYAPVGSLLSINSMLGLGLSHESDDFDANGEDFVNAYYVGGFGHGVRNYQVPFLGLNNHELLFNNYALARLGLQVNPSPNLYVSALANLVFISDNRSSFFDDVVNNPRDVGYLGAGAGITYKTPLGPISVYLGSLTTEWRPIWYTNIGFTF